MSFVIENLRIVHVIEDQEPSFSLRFGTPVVERHLILAFHSTVKDFVVSHHGGFSFEGHPKDGFVIVLEGQRIMRSQGRFTNAGKAIYYHAVLELKAFKEDIMDLLDEAAASLKSLIRDLWNADHKSTDYNKATRPQSIPVLIPTVARGITHGLPLGAERHGRLAPDQPPSSPSTANSARPDDNQIRLDQKICKSRCDLHRQQSWALSHRKDLGRRLRDLQPVENFSAIRERKSGGLTHQMAFRLDSFEKGDEGEIFCPLDEVIPMLFGKERVSFESGHNIVRGLIEDRSCHFGDDGPRSCPVASSMWSGKEDDAVCGTVC